MFKLIVTLIVSSLSLVATHFLENTLLLSRSQFTWVKFSANRCALQYMSPLTTPQLSSISRLLTGARHSRLLHGGNMSSLSDQSENLHFVGQTSSDHSHAAPPLPQYSSHSIYLDGVGTLFPSSKASYDTNVDFSDDEAFMLQPGEEATTPPANRNFWAYDSPNEGQPDNYPPTPRLTPARGPPFLPLSEYPEFERQRAAKKGCNIGLGKYVISPEDCILIPPASRGKRHLALSAKVQHARPICLVAIGTVQLLKQSN